MSARDRAARLLADRRVPAAATLLGVLLALPSLWGNFHPEDIFFRDAAGLGQILFGTVGDPRHANMLAKDTGVLPWIASEDWQLAFSRPLTTLTHRLDYAWWPESPVAMHAHNLVWFAALLFGAATLFRRWLSSPAAAGLAGLLYAVDDAHGFGVGWISNRNALVATAFGIGALLLHDRWRSARSTWAGIAAPFFLWLALGGGEMGLGAVAYIAAYALFVDTGKRRWLTLWPTAVALLLWAVPYQLGGFGAHGSGIYVTPSNDPVAFLGLAIARLPLLTLGALGVVPAAVAGLLVDHWPAVFVPIAAGILLLVALGSYPIVRASREAKFWSTGAILSALPICAALPEDRLLFFPGLGVMALIALVVRRALTSPHDLGRLRPFVVFSAFALLFLQGVLSPVLLPVRAFGIRGATPWLARAAESALAGHQSSEQHLIVVSAPDLAVGSLMLGVYSSVEGPIPQHTRVLHGGQNGLVVTRVDANALVLRPEGGFMATPPNKFFRLDGMRVGDELQLTAFRSKVLAVDDDGMPTEVEFRFGWPLEDGHLRWVGWDGKRFVPFTPPAVGESARLPPSMTDWSLEELMAQLH